MSSVNAHESYWLGKRQEKFIELNGSLGEPCRLNEFKKYPYIPEKDRENFIKHTQFPIRIKNGRYVSI